jgi:hypothetical protein
MSPASQVNDDSVILTSKALVRRTRPRKELVNNKHEEQKTVSKELTVNKHEERKDGLERTDRKQARI